MIEALRAQCPFPSIGKDGQLLDGLLLKQPRVCVKCRLRSCARRHDEGSGDVASHKPCEFGVSTVLIRTGVGRILINGVLVVGENNAVSPAQRKALRGTKVTRDQLLEYQRRLDASLPVLQAAVDEAASVAVSGQHDIRAAVGALYRNVEAVIAELPGENDYDRIERADPKLKGLLKSASLLRSRLELAPIAVNPEAASYGQRRRIPVYRAVHRLVRLFEQTAQVRNVHLQMAGQSNATIRCFDSFEVVPLALIENAIKYAESGSDVVIRVDDIDSNTCVVAVESRGPIVPADEREHLFEKGFRGRDAKIQAAGSGLGLYSASVVCRAHGCELRYEARPFPSADGRGINVFYLALADDAP